MDLYNWTISKQVDSSNLSKIEYDENKQIMRITFKNNSIYDYSKVTIDIVSTILAGSFTNQKGEPSIGATFIKLVKNNSMYPFKKIK